MRGRNVDVDLCLYSPQMGIQMLICSNPLSSWGVVVPQLVFFQSCNLMYRIGRD